MLQRQKTIKKRIEEKKFIKKIFNNFFLFHNVKVVSVYRHIILIVKSKETLIFEYKLWINRQNLSSIY